MHEEKQKWRPHTAQSCSANSATTTMKKQLLRRSVHLDVNVDVADELERGEECDGAEHEEEDVACEQSVAEELDCLQHP